MTNIHCTPCAVLRTICVGLIWPEFIHIVPSTALSRLHIPPHALTYHLHSWSKVLLSLWYYCMVNIENTVLYCCEEGGMTISFDRKRRESFTSHLQQHCSQSSQPHWRADRSKCSDCAAWFALTYYTTQTYSCHYQQDNHTLHL